MNAMQALSLHPWVERLGWTLLHFLWQGLAIAGLYAGVRRALARTSSPNLRYLLACAALAAMMAAPVATWAMLGAPDAGPEAAWLIQSAPPTGLRTGAAGTTWLPASARDGVPGVQPAPFLLWVVVAWLAGAVLFWARLAGGWVVASRMRSVQVRRAQAEWQQALKRLGARMGLSRPVRLLVSALVQAPTVAGWLRPVVLIPVGALAGLTAEQMEALLLHELAHIRRHDYLVNILQNAGEALLFYHPAVWWVSGHIRTERELCCDDAAVSVTGDALTYARALARLESCRPPHFSAAVAANGGSLADRIARLLGQSRPAASTGLGPGALAAAMLLVAAAYGLFGQSGAHPSFQAASIKQNDSEWSERTHHPMGVGYMLGGRMKATNASLQLLIRFAYAPHDNRSHSLPLMASQVVGGPAWVDSVGYDIEAKPEGNTDSKHAWLMLQTLLADRFKLALHRETRELPVYVLSESKKGFKLPAPKDVDCVSFPPGTPPRQIAGKTDCGYVPVLADPTGLRMTGSKLHMADLVREVATVLDRPVLDKTGFTGEFDLNLHFSADEAIVGLEGIGGPGDSDRPNIFAALQEQLGLKLAPGKGPVEVLVIDHAERPTAN